MASKLIRMRAKKRGYYSKPEEIAGDPKHGLTYAPGVRTSGKLYDPDSAEAKKDPTSLIFWCREQDFSDYSKEKMIVIPRTDKKGNAVFGKDGKPIMLEKSAGRGWMERVEGLVAAEPAPERVTIQPEEPNFVKPVTETAVSMSAQPVAKKRGRPARPVATI